MKIKKMISQHRRDFRAVYACDHEDCDYTEEGPGYDDSNFHQNVIPKMKCKKCGRQAIPEKYSARGTKYPDHVTV